MIRMERQVPVSTVTMEPEEDNDKDKMLTNSNLTDYEQRRARNIVRNNRQLLALGLISSVEEQHSNAAAWGLEIPSGEGYKAFLASQDTRQPKASTKKRKLEKTPNQQPLRQSARLQGQPAANIINADESDLLDGKDPANDGLSMAEERKRIVQECREARLRRALEEGEEKAAKENPTATYEHCLMRVRTMTDKGLINRIKTIERAAGKHCVVKMAIFKCCLEEKDKWDIAKLASEALERLKALQPPPE
jgi:hypothetical protein